MEDKKKVMMLSAVVIIAVAGAIFMGMRTMSAGATGEGNVSYTNPPPSDTAPVTDSPAAGGAGATAPAPADGEGPRGQ